MELPVEFTDRMRELLGEEYDAFIESYQEPRHHALRLNTLKISPEKFEQISSFHLSPVPWIPNAFYYEEQDPASRHPFYAAGLYYLQEPSAMTPASVFDVRPGMKVLDLCAAPGGKSTALGVKLNGEGLLVSNDISGSRCKALLHNIEIFGIPNALVTNAVPARLAEHFPCFFDRILVDAPCSGEGMFRKDDSTISAWYPQKPDDCGKIQREIVTQAVKMLSPGGQLMYSTCTFAPEEDEEIVRFILNRFPQMKLCSLPRADGFSEGLTAYTIHGEKRPEMPELSQCVRLWPHKIGGEGHFMALLCRKTGTDSAAAFEENAQSFKSISTTEKQDRRSGGRGSRARSGKETPDRQQQEILRKFLKDVRKTYKFDHLKIHENMVFLDTGEIQDNLAGIACLRNGLYMGELKKDRFEPSQAYAMTLDSQTCTRVLNLEAGDERINRYLRGETLNLTGEETKNGNGWTLVCVSGYPLGWGKNTGSILKNKYLAGWRTRS